MDDQPIDFAERQRLTLRRLDPFGGADLLKTEFGLNPRTVQRLWSGKQPLNPALADRIADWLDRQRDALRAGDFRRLAELAERRIAREKAARHG